MSLHISASTILCYSKILKKYSQLQISQYILILTITKNKHTHTHCFNDHYPGEPG